MGFSFSSLSEIFTHEFDAVIDVRAPAEFGEDHLPGAINLPVLSDTERAKVGTIYVQESPFKARKIGAALVAANAALHLQGPLADMNGSWRPLIYCWRGGQRSGSFASILQQIGWRAEVLDGGYKSYRKLVVGDLYERDFACRVHLLDGLTGTAKTDILKRYSALGGQAIDLEGLARHRGSLLGGYCGGQPSQKAFEGALACALSGLDQNRPLLLEAESSKIGERIIPPALWAVMKKAPRVRVEAPVEARAEYLVRAYPDLVQDPERLKRSLRRLSPFVSNDSASAFAQMAEEGSLVALAQVLIEEHYDPRYRRGVQDPENVIRLEDLGRDEIDRAATQLLELVDPAAGK